MRFKTFFINSIFIILFAETSTLFADTHCPPGRRQLSVSLATGITTQGAWIDKPLPGDGTKHSTYHISTAFLYRPSMRKRFLWQFSASSTKSQGYQKKDNLFAITNQSFFHSVDVLPGYHLRIRLSRYHDEPFSFTFSSGISGGYCASQTYFRETNNKIVDRGFYVGVPLQVVGSVYIFEELNIGLFYRHTQVISPRLTQVNQFQKNQFSNAGIMLRFFFLKAGGMNF